MNVKGKLYTHRYPPLIDKVLFDECQEVAKRWNKQKFQYGGIEFLFRGLIKCANSGRTVTNDRKTRKYVSGGTASWTYLGYWDKTKKKRWVREDAILKQVEDALKAFKIDSDVLPSVIEYIKESNRNESDYINLQRDEMNKKVEVVQYRIDRLLNLHLDGLIDRDTFDNKKLELTTERNQLINEVVLSHQGDDRFKNAALAIITLISGLPEKLSSLTFEEKRNVIKMVFSNLTMKDGTLCCTYNKLLDEFKNLTNCIEWRAVIDKVRTTSELRNELIRLYSIYLSND